MGQLWMRRSKNTTIPAFIAWMMLFSLCYMLVPYVHHWVDEAVMAQSEPSRYDAESAARLTDVERRLLRVETRQDQVLFDVSTLKTEFEDRDTVVKWFAAALLPLLLKAAYDMYLVKKGAKPSG